MKAIRELIRKNKPTVFIISICLLLLIPIWAYIHESKEVKRELASKNIMTVEEFKAIEPTTTEPVAEPETNTYLDIPLSAEYQEWLFTYCYERNISPYLVIAIMERESEFDSSKIGDNGNSYGLMQINKKWHLERMDKLFANDLLNPYDNAIVGIDYLLELFQKNPDVYWVLMAYNGGQAYSDRNMDNPTDYAIEICGRASELER